MYKCVRVHIYIYTHTHMRTYIYICACVWDIYFGRTFALPCTSFLWGKDAICGCNISGSAGQSVMWHWPLITGFKHILRKGLMLCQKRRKHDHPSSPKFKKEVLIWAAYSSHQQHFIGNGKDVNWRTKSRPILYFLKWTTSDVCIKAEKAFLNACLRDLCSLKVQFRSCRLIFKCKHPHWALFTI